LDKHLGTPPITSTYPLKSLSRHRPRFANRHGLIAPRCRLNTYGRRAFPVAGPTVWNSLPEIRRVILTASNSWL